MLDLIENGRNKITHQFVRVKCYEPQPIPKDKSKETQRDTALCVPQIFASWQRNLQWTFAWEWALRWLWVWVSVLAVGLPVEQNDMVYAV